MNKKNKIKAIIAIAVALAFIMPVAVVANDGTIGVTSDIEITNDIENIVETSTNSDISDNIEIASDDEVIEDPFIEPTVEDPVIDAEELSIVIDDSSAVLTTGNTTYVDDDADPSWYDATHVRTIKEGITNSSAGDNVHIYNGIYTESKSVTIDKQLNIFGASRENVILNGKSSGYNQGCINIFSNNVNISTLTLHNTYYYDTIYAKGSNAINIKSCNIYTDKKSYSGIYVMDCSNVNIINCTGYDCKYGIYIHSSSYVDIINCDAYNNKGNGIHVTMPVNPTRIINCTTHDNAPGNGIQVEMYYYSVAPFLVENCISYNNSGSGIYVRYMKEGDIIGCTTYNNKYSGIGLSNSEHIDVTNCTIHDNTREGIVMGSADYCNVTNCKSYNNNFGIYMNGASKCYLARNIMYNNTYNFAVDDGLDHIVDPTNTVGGLPIYWLNGGENITLDETYTFGFLGLARCNNITVKDNSANGVAIGYTTNVKISNFTASNTYHGFYFYGGSNIKIEKCTASSNGKYGFYFYYTDNVEISDCTATNMLVTDADAFYIKESPDIKITNCIAHDVGLSYGFNIKNCPNANVINCQAYNGGPTWATGIALYSSPHTNVINCTIHHFQRGFTMNSGCSFTNFTDCTVYNLTYEGFEADAPDCNYLNCTLYNSGGFFPTKPRNTFTNCKSYNNQHGVSLNRVTENNFLNCEFYDNSGIGIDLHGTSYSNTFTNCKSYNNTGGLDKYGHPCGYGVLIIKNSYGNVFTDCDVYNNNYGFHIEDSPNNILRNTVLTNNNHSLEVVDHYYQDIDTSNTIDGKLIYYLVDKENMTVGATSNVGYLKLVSCNNITVQNLDIPDLMLIQTTNSTLSNIKVHDNDKVYIRKSYSYRSKDGIYLWESSDNEITGCTVYNSTRHGIYLLNSPSNTITGCTVYDNNYGIYLSASNNILRSNILSGNTVDFGVTGTLATDFIQDIDESNLIDGGPMYYIVGDSDKTIDETDTFSYLILVACDNMTLQNLDVGDLPIILTTNSTLSNIEAHDGKDGIYLWESSYNDIVGCTVYNHTGHGIYLRDSHNNIIKLCDAYNNGNGFYLSGSSYNDLIQCKAYSNTNGIYLTAGSAWNNIMVCETYNNSNGIYLISSNNNIILCELHDNSNGIYLDISKHCNIENCDIYGNSNGVYVYGSYNVNLYNTIKECKIHGNSNGIYYAKYCKGGTAVNNTIYDNNYGIYYFKYVFSIGNKAYHNTLASNVHNAYSYYTNEWDDGYPSGGNYWDDYSGIDNFSGPSQNITGSDGIGDTPYVLGRITDHYPLMNPPGGDITPPEIKDVVLTNSTPIDTDPVFGWEKVTCNVIDAGSGVNDVKLVVTYPNASIVKYPMDKAANTYSYEITLTDAGDYTYHIWANDTNGNIAEPTPEQTFVLPENWDMNDDRFCDISDLRMVALHFGETGVAGWIREDYSNDGICDISDLRMVALHFGDTY